MYVWSEKMVNYPNDYHIPGQNTWNWRIIYKYVRNRLDF